MKNTIDYATLDFEALCALPNDGRKKFYLLKNFGRDVAGWPPLKLRELGCDAIEALIRQDRTNWFPGTEGTHFAGKPL